jgi:hypothetical protein
MVATGTGSTTGSGVTASGSAVTSAWLVLSGAGSGLDAFLANMSGLAARASAPT